MLRENQRVLAMVLAIFVQEPLTEPEEAERASAIASGIFIRPMIGGGEAADERRMRSSHEMNRRVREKLSGADFGGDENLGVEEQAARLIDQAMDNYNLSRMYSGWCPFW
jgi:phosphatidylinositol kinase/protein kinase (PI-3  family)